MLTLVQLSEVENDKRQRYLEHLVKIQTHHYRDERQERILRIRNEIKEYNDARTNKV